MRRLTVTQSSVGKQSATSGNKKIAKINNHVNNDRDTKESPNLAQTNRSSENQQKKEILPN